MRRADSWKKTLMLGKIEGRRRRGTTEDEMVAWYHWLNGHEFGWTPGVGDVQGGMVCCSPWDGKELAMTERLNWTKCIYVNSSLPVLHTNSACSLYTSIHCLSLMSVSLFRPYKWTKKMWHNYIQWNLTTKRNTIGSFVETWTVLQPVIQSEISQKSQKQTLYINICMWNQEKW